MLVQQAVVLRFIQISQIQIKRKGISIMKSFRYLIHLFVFVLWVLFQTNVAFAQWNTNSEEVSDNEWQKSKGKFGAALFLSSKPEEFLKAWDKPTKGVPMSTADKVKRGVPIVGFVLFTGCREDPSELCNTVMDI
jgi:hypothetical protein